MGNEAKRLHTVVSARCLSSGNDYTDIQRHMGRGARRPWPPRFAQGVLIVLPVLQALVPRLLEAFTNHT